MPKESVAPSTTGNPTIKPKDPSTPTPSQENITISAASEPSPGVSEGLNHTHKLSIISHEQISKDTSRDGYTEQQDVLPSQLGEAEYTSRIYNTSEELVSFLQRWSFPPENRYKLLAISCEDITARKYPLSDKDYISQMGQNLKDYNEDKVLVVDLVKGARNVPPLTTIYERSSLPTGWKQFIHPQGRLYYWNESTRTLTDVDLYHPGLLKLVNTATDQIYHELHKLSSTAYIPADIQLVLDLAIREGNPVFGYYFASLERRCLFWLKKHNISGMIKDFRTLGHMTHILYDGSRILGTTVHSPFARLHYQTFPDVQELPDAVLGEMKAFILYTGVVEVSHEEINDYMQFLSLLQNDSGSKDPTSGYVTWAVGLTMNFFALHKFKNFYGQRNVRWRRDQELFEGEIPCHSRFLSLLSPFLLYTPQRYIHSLNTILDGEFVFTEAWSDFVKELHGEWQNLILIATVILTTNVAFLAIQSVDNTETNNRSVEQILSYISTIASTASILMSQLIATYHRTKGLENLDERIQDNFQFLPSLGSELLAVTYSLPYVFLTWGYVHKYTYFQSELIHYGFILQNAVIPGGIPCALFREIR
ncbi:hypothetical protein M422DRAFT_41003 [Sphaerobolus stellatus SS14]|nr:hypothetical protein M422DRAFT_41003 [Sphaerobolus stellatus SS14]